MQLAFCLYKYFPFGGLQRDFLRIAKECTHRGHTVDVYTMEWDGEKNSGLNIHVLPVSGWQNHKRACNFVKEFSKAITQKKYDLVVGFNKMPGLDVYFAADTCYQAKARKKHGIFYRLTPRYRHLVHYENAVFTKNAKTKILLISPFQKNEFIHFYQTPEQRFYFLPPGIARDRLAPDNAAEIRAETRREFGIHENDFLLLMVGSGFKTKGLDRVIAGFAALPDELKKRSKLFIIGKDHAELYEKQAAQLGITEYIRFLGGRYDVPRLFLAGDLLLHPAYSENTGTVLLEAVASGLPVLTTDNCGYAHYIEEANAGMVLPSPFQQKQFNQTIQNMLLSPERSTWHLNGITFAKQADIYNLAEHAVDIIEAIPCAAIKCS